MNRTLVISSQPKDQHCHFGSALCVEIVKALQVAIECPMPHALGPPDERVDAAEADYADFHPAAADRDVGCAAIV